MLSSSGLSLLNKHNGFSRKRVAMPPLYCLHLHYIMAV
uniref:Uncharacterized protein n=1 Tax=Anguilla anguilla TaxID=7936 RepID=A0A0E9TR83_ANGAN